MDFVWFLLPIAMWLGWQLSKRKTKRSEQKTAECGTAFYKSINYLLNEQPDKAIEVFIQMLEVDNETVETHLALGNLFRRRGEVDRAIRLHQNLIARPNLNEEQRTQALLELGQDYMKAGLFDRAESLFLELIDINAHSEIALTFLVQIYQQEKEWNKAISIAEQLEDTSKESMKTEIAQYYCELADEQVMQKQPERVVELLQQALKYDPDCVRASITLGNLAMDGAEFKRAIEYFSVVHKQDSDFCPQVLPKLMTCHEEQGGIKAMMEYLEKILQDHFSTSLMLMLAGLIQAEEGDEPAMAFLSSQLRIHPSVQGLEQMVALSLSSQKSETETLEILRDLMKRLLQDRPHFKCQGCGFEGKSLHWQCPRCKQWAQVKPIQVSSSYYL